MVKLSGFFFSLHSRLSPPWSRPLFSTFGLQTRARARYWKAPNNGKAKSGSFEKIIVITF